MAQACLGGTSTTSIGHQQMVLERRRQCFHLRFHLRSRLGPRHKLALAGLLSGSTNVSSSEGGSVPFYGAGWGLGEIRRNTHGHRTRKRVERERGRCEASLWVGGSLSPRCERRDETSAATKRAPFHCRGEAAASGQSSATIEPPTPTSGVEPRRRAAAVASQA